MARVVGIDHLVIRVSDYQKSKAFYGRLFTFLGFEISPTSMTKRSAGPTARRAFGSTRRMRKARSNKVAAMATSASITTHSNSAVARMSMSCRRS